MLIYQTRRQFLQRGIACAGALAGSRIFGAPAILADAATSGKLRTAVIGCGGRGGSFHIPAALGERLVALVDVDDKKIAAALKPGKKGGSPHPNPSEVKSFTDYRKMFDTMGKEIDAVFIATPNHHHALPALMAMKLGMHVYCEKPLTHTVFEARQMAEFARKYKVTTQMGNQGHSAEGDRRFCEYIWAGAIGQVTEVHSWSNRANGGIGPRPATLPVPEGLHWEEWIGPAPYREFHKDLHPHEWHGWHDFGNGSLGNMGAHVLDASHWALKLGDPTCIEVEEMVGGSNERYPVGTRIRWDYAARGEMPPVKVYWYDGKRKGVKQVGVAENDTEDSIDEKSRNLPPILLELEKKYKTKFPTNGAIYVGSKGYMFTEAWGRSTRIVPEEQQKATPVPEKSLPRIKGSHTGDFLRACRGGEPACANFEYAAPFTEMMLLGALACIAGPGKKLEWDAPNMKVTNLPELNQCLKRENRKGWTI